MKPARAVIFDLDETLYPERRFALSGMAAVAADVHRRHRVPRRVAFNLMLDALRHGRRAFLLQALCASCGVPESEIPRLVRLIRTHWPSLRLPASSRAVLKALRADWRLGVLTNGMPAIQERKIAALGVRSLVDAVIYACEQGGGGGKPDPAVFQAMCDRLRVHPAHAIFVGDDPWCDIAGAKRFGMRTIRIRRGIHARAAVAPDNEADAVVSGIAAVPGIIAAWSEYERDVAA